MLWERASSKFSSPSSQSDHSINRGGFLPIGVIDLTGMDYHSQNLGRRIQTCSNVSVDERSLQSKFVLCYRYASFAVVSLILDM
jgi:hypothetical protein